MNTTGEWISDSRMYGRRYRIVNGVREYEATIMTSSGNMTESQLADFNQRKKEQAAALYGQRDKMEKSYCPFGGGNHNCVRDMCALYSGNGCNLADATPTPARNTAGKSCPFNAYQCREDCELFKNGCCVLASTKERT